MEDPKSPTRVILLIYFPQLFEDNFKTITLSPLVHIK